jgi:hypothetical protein
MQTVFSSLNTYIYSVLSTNRIQCYSDLGCGKEQICLDVKLKIFISCPQNLEFIFLFY